MFKINDKNLISLAIGLLLIFTFAVALTPEKTKADQTFNCEISNFNVSSNYVAPGGSTTLNWNTNNCNSINITNVGSVASSGSQTVYPMNTTIYTLTAYGSNGMSVYSSKTVTVQRLHCEIANFNVSSSFINSGGSVVLNWNTNNCNSINISRLGNVGSSGNQTVYPGDTTTYILTAYGNNGQSITSSKTVTVQELSCEISNFNVSQNHITSGDSSKITWTTNNCNSVNITGIGSVASSGSQTVFPDRTTTYTLTAYSSNGNSFYQTKTVNVTTPIVKNTTSSSSNNTTNNNTTTKNSSTTKTNTSNKNSSNSSVTNTTNQSNQDSDNQNENGSNALAGNALFGANGFLPSSLLGWLVFAILVLLAIVLWRKLYVSESDKNVPLKHA